MRTIQTTCLVLFIFSLFPWQSNFRWGQEDNCTEVWTERTFFPTRLLPFHVSHTELLPLRVDTDSPAICAFVDVHLLFQALGTKIIPGPCAVGLQKIPAE